MQRNKSSSRSLATVSHGVEKRGCGKTAGCYPHPPDALAVSMATDRGSCGVQIPRITVGQIKTDIDLTELVKSFVDCLDATEIATAATNLRECLRTFAARALVLNSQQVELTNGAQANQIVTMMIDHSKAMFGAGGVHYTESRIYWNVTQSFPSLGFTADYTPVGLIPRTTGQIQLQYSLGLNPVLQFAQATTFDGTNIELDKATISANLLSVFGIKIIPKGTLIYSGAI